MYHSPTNDILIFATDPRNNYNLVYEGRAHLLKHTNFDEKQLIFNRVNSGCRGAVYTNLEVNTVLRIPHAETSSVDNSILHKIEKMNTLKRCARKETKPVPQIYSEAYRSASTSLVTVLVSSGQFPTCKKVKAAMYRSHAKRFPPLLATCQQMEIPVQWRVTKSGRQLLLYRNVNNSVSIVCTEENLRELAAHSVWCMDGTFKIVPEWYIHTFRKSKLIPLAARSANQVVERGDLIRTYGDVLLSRPYSPGETSSPCPVSY
ncbi:hypothetical protein T03_17819 [Trichinella britovi]|uniref:Uncharacterized protein n=1 Tax=Trichinella britovi TaxID=45882 RepID=A0A0V1C9N6_TRIBR|nr:hypothetical protein T03_17819 [Trichinella britovi]